MRTSLRPRRLLGAVAAGTFAVLALAGCFGTPDVVVGQYVSGLSVPSDSGTEGLIVPAQLPTGSADGPAATVESAVTVVNGGSIQQNVTSDTEFSIVRVAIESLVDAEGEPREATGTPGFGYWEIELAEPTTEANVVLTVPQALPNSEFITYFAVATAEDAQGAIATQDVEAVTVGTGDVQVSVSWDVDSDLDLHVVSPNGEEIYWGVVSDSTGGSLDLDSNAGCAIDSVRNENVTWATGDAPAGEYKVLIDLWDACGVEPTNYVVTVTVVGGATQTYTGSVDGPGDQGEAGAGELVATFEVAEAE